jgi:predicted CoA-substrate-specific enzyme activase
MLFAGIDVGAQSVKAVLFDGQKILGQKVQITEEGAEVAGLSIYQDLLADLGFRPEEVERVTVTGWGAGEVSFADGKSSEPVCAAKGARWLVPTACTVVDLGAEGCRVMKLGPDGTLEDFTTNSKCASGTGSFIELGAVYLKVPLEQMGALSLAAEGVAEVSSTCAVFAESVIISHIHAGESRERIAAGIHRAAAARVIELIGRVGLVEDIVLVGGAALNSGLIAMLETMTGRAITVPEHPRCVVALGAAIQAYLKYKKGDKDSRGR